MAPDDFHPEATDSAVDFEKNEFLDLRKPLLRQVWEANFRFAYLISSCSFHTKISWEAKHTIFSKYTSPDIWRNLHGCLVLIFWKYESCLRFDIECLMQCKIDVYPNRVVCRAYVLGTYHDLSVPSFSLAIYRTSPDFLWKSYHTPISHLLHSHGLRSENIVMFLPRKSCVDDSGVHFASLLVPCRPLASR